MARKKASLIRGRSKNQKTQDDLIMDEKHDTTENASDEEMEIQDDLIMDKNLIQQKSHPMK